MQNKEFKLRLISKLEKVNKEIHDKDLFPKDYLLDVIQYIAEFVKLDEEKEYEDWLHDWNRHQFYEDDDDSEEIE